MGQALPLVLEIEQWKKPKVLASRSLHSGSEKGTEVVYSLWVCGSGGWDGVISQAKELAGGKILQRSAGYSRNQNQANVAEA